MPTHGIAKKIPAPELKQMACAVRRSGSLSPFNSFNMRWVTTDQMARIANTATTEIPM